MKWQSNRFIIEIISSPNWKKGKPKNPKLLKWLVQITDRFTQDQFCPNDFELQLLTKTMNKEELKMLSEALQIKEKHNLPNLENPESRLIENYIHELAGN